MDISIMIEGQMGLTWDRWKRLVADVESLGFAGLFRSDHFTNAGPPDQDSLECWVSLAYAADRSERIHFGPLVSPVSFRNPVFLARQGAAVDDLSGGRFLLGVGAGWQQREHEKFGFDLGDIPTRVARFEEALEIITRLLRSDAPVSFEGRFFNVKEAVLFPRPKRPSGPPILIGGSGIKKTLPLVARYADVWNGFGQSPNGYRELCERLDQLLEKEGRKPSEVKKTLMTGIFYGAGDGELERKFQPLRGNPNLKDLSTSDLAELVREHGAVVGGPEQVAGQIKSLEEAGAEEVMLQWLDLEDLEGLASFAQAVL